APPPFLYLQLASVGPGAHQPFVVTRQLGEAEGLRPGLPLAQQLAGAAQAQVLLGDDEAVAGRGEGGEAAGADLAGGTVHGDAPRRPAAAADAAAELVKLGEAE